MVGPGVVLGVGLVVLGVSVPMPPAAPEFIPEAVPPDELPPEEVAGPERMSEEPGPVLPPMDEPLSVELPDELPVLLPAEPELDLPPVMPVHATISIAQATDIIHLVIDHSR